MFGHVDNFQQQLQYCSYLTLGQILSTTLYCLSQTVRGCSLRFALGARRVLRWAASRPEALPGPPPMGPRPQPSPQCAPFSPQCGCALLNLVQLLLTAANTSYDGLREYTYIPQGSGIGHNPIHQKRVCSAAVVGTIRMCFYSQMDCSLHTSHTI